LLRKINVNPIVNRILKKQDAEKEAQVLALKKREEEAAIQAEKALMEKNTKSHADHGASNIRKTVFFFNLTTEIMFCLSR
jgi:hypothetical protein